jgi:hypothetical protein
MIRIFLVWLGLLFYGFIYSQNKRLTQSKYFYVDHVQASWQDSGLAKKHFGKKVILPEILKMIPTTLLKPDSNQFKIVFDFKLAQFNEKTKGLLLETELAMHIEVLYDNGKSLERLTEYELSSSGPMLATDKKKQLQKYWDKAIDYLLEKTDEYLAKSKNKILIPGKAIQINAKHIDNKIDNEDTLSYLSSRKLIAADFKGKRDDLSRAGGATYSGIGIDYNTRIENFIMYLDIEVLCYFDKSKSWLMNMSKNNPRIIAHEQLHFDICYWYTLELMKALKVQSVTYDNAKKNIEKIYRSNFEAYEKAQDAYDTETNHGLKENEQSRWDALVAEKIKALETESNQ